MGMTLKETYNFIQNKVLFETVGVNIKNTTIDDIENKADNVFISPETMVIKIKNFFKSHPKIIETNSPLRLSDKTPVYDYPVEPVYNRYGQISRYKKMGRDAEYVIHLKNFEVDEYKTLKRDCVYFNMPEDDNQLSSVKNLFNGYRKYKTEFFGRHFDLDFSYKQTPTNIELKIYCDYKRKKPQSCGVFFMTGYPSGSGSGSGIQISEMSKEMLTNLNQLLISLDKYYQEKIYTD